MALEFKLNDSLTIGEEAHAKLLEYCTKRLDAAKDVHASATDRFAAIDKEVAGYIRLDDDDKKRKDDTEKGYGPKPYSMNLQLVRTQIDEAVTYIMSVFYPEEGPYTAIAPKEKQATAKGLSVLMNQHADRFKHYRHMSRSVFDAMKYNLGLATVDWEEVRGTRLGNTVNGGLNEEQNVVLADGNKMESLDVYNTLLDPSVNPIDIATDGEFFATIKVRTKFRAERHAAVGNIFNMDYVNQIVQRQTPQTSYYTEKPDITGDAIKGNGYATNWVSYLTAGNLDGNVFQEGSIEFVTLRIWLPAKTLGLDDKAEGFQIWKITLANAKAVVYAEPMVNAHGILPLFAMMPWDDHFDRQTQSFAEVLLPYQRFASFQMNIHQHAQRKALYGLTVFNETLLPDLKESDMVAGRIPMKQGLNDLSINDLIKQFSDAPDTQNTLRDVGAMSELMQKLLPTDQAGQVASLERATMYQAAATVQAGNRRNLKIAKTLDSQAMEPLRRASLYNILQFQKQVKILQPDGTEIEIDPTQLRSVDFAFTIGAGLRGIDKLIIVETLKEMLFAILQSPQATQTIDVVSLMDYITSTMGDYADLKQFKFMNEFDRLTPEQKQTAFQLLQRAMQSQAESQGAGSVQQPPQGAGQGMAQ